MQNNLYCAIKSCATVSKMFLYMQDNVLRRAGKCWATVRGMFLCEEDFDSEDGFIDFSKLALFIDDQGSGKSTVAKLFSLCSWLEKAFFSW